MRPPSRTGSPILSAVNRALPIQSSREAHVVDEKEPDVRFREVSDASVAMEIKVVDDWTRKDLETALTDQLCGRYLRAKDARHGILLLVYQKARPIGWQSREAGVFLNFDEVAEHLRLLAAGIAGAETDGPLPEIAVLDVSRCSH